MQVGDRFVLADASSDVSHPADKRGGRGGSGPLGQVISGPCSNGGHGCQWLV